MQMLKSKVTRLAGDVEEAAPVDSSVVATNAAFSFAMKAFHAETVAAGAAYVDWVA
jgi:hypothetical protein